MLAVPDRQPPQEGNSWPLQVVPVHVPRQLQPSAGLPLQLVQFGAHDSIWHAPLLQVSVAKYWQHLVPQVPQLSASVCRSTQAPLHAVSPAWHCDVHAPVEHTWVDPQAVPQVPQF